MEIKPDQLTNGWYFAVLEGRYLIVRPTTHPYYILEESDDGKQHRLMMHTSSLMQPQEALSALTAVGDRNAILAVLKQINPGTEGVTPIYEVDLLQLAVKYSNTQPQLMTPEPEAWRPSAKEKLNQVEIGH